MPEKTPPQNILTEKDFDALLKSINQVALVSMTDAKGDILYANSKFVEVSKYPLAELLGQNHRILKSGHQSDELFVDLWHTITSGLVWRGEIKNRAKDGSYYWVDTAIAPILDASGKPERYISIRFVISEKKQLEESVQSQMHDLELVNQAMMGRELKMIKLKNRIKELEAKLEADQA